MRQFIYRVVWECVVEQWLGVRRMLSNERLAMGCVEGICCIRKFIEEVDVTHLLLCDQYSVLVKYLQIANTN